MSPSYLGGGLVVDYRLPGQDALGLIPTLVLLFNITITGVLNSNMGLFQIEYAYIMQYH